MVYRTFIKSGMLLNPYYLYYLFQYCSASTYRDVESTRYALKKLKKHNAYFFIKAHYCYFHAKYKEAIKFLNKSIDLFPNHAESHYLKAKCLMRQDEQEEASALLYDFLSISKRKKTWLYLSQAVTNKAQFLEFDKQFQKHFQGNDSVSMDLISYYSEAALNAKAYKHAENMWKKHIKQGGENSPPKKAQYRRPHSFSPKNAEQALLHIKAILDEHNIKFFLISGTLLGCIRENRILPHDKDLDIGIWENETSIQNLKEVVTSAGVFEIMPNRVKTLLKIKHLNGTFIDLFIHYKEENQVWHATSKTKWINSNFDLIEHDFLGDFFLIPKEYETYLAENYGSKWQIPKKSFDSTFDTPNAKTLSINEQTVYEYKTRLLK